MCFLLVITVFFISCKSAKNTITPEQMALFDEMISKKEIDIEFIWAQPSGLFNNVRGIENLLPNGSTVGSISLIGNDNYLKIIKDSIAMDIPYYGEQQLSSSSSYGTSGIGLAYNGIPEKFSETFNKKRNRYVLKYTMKAKTEILDIILYLYPNYSTTLSVNSSHRSTINYNGNWKVLTVKKE